MAFKQSNNPISRKTSPINKNWIQGAIKRPGAFRKKAEEAGMSTKAFAEKVTSNKEDYSTRTGRQAELAETLMGMSRESSEQGDFDYEDPNYRNTPEYKKFKRKQKRLERKNKGKDPDQEIVERDDDLSREANEDMGLSRKASPLNAGDWGDLSGDKIYGPATAAIHVGKKIIKKGKKFVQGAAKLGKKVGKAIKETSEAAQTGGPYKK